MPTRPGKTSAKRPKGAIDPSQPLRLAQRELFAQFIANGVPVPEAYRRAGYSGGDDARWDLRRSAEVDARVNWLLAERVRADTEARHKREKKTGDLRDRVLKELERIAFSDARDVCQWDRVPVVDPEGSVTGYRDELTATPSHRLTRDAAASVRSVTTKGGALKIDVHDKLAALDKLARALGIFSDAAPVAGNVTVQQVNVGDVSALEVARRMAFLLASAGQEPQAREPATIDAKPEPPKPAQSQ